MNAKPLVIRKNMSGSNKIVNKRKQFSLSEKINTLKQTDSEKKRAAVTKELGITPTRECTVLKYREKNHENV
jgi:hypothetical protein